MAEFKLQGVLDSCVASPARTQIGHKDDDTFYGI